MTEENDAGARLHELFERDWARTMAEHPELATYTGWPDHHDRWTDLSVDAVERRRHEAGDLLDALDAVDPDRLGETDRVSREMFAYLERAEVAAAAFPGDYLPLNQMEGPQLDPAFLLSVMPRDTVRHHDDLLARLRRLPDLVDQSIELLVQGLARGLTPPRICLREVPGQLDALLGGEPGANPLLLAFDGTPDEVRAEAAALVRERVAPAYARLRGYLVDTYLPDCRDTVGLRDLPDGSDWYAERVRAHTTTTLSPEEIHETGLAEVARIDAAMDDVMASTGFHGDRAAFATFLATDERFRFATDEALLAAYRDIAKRIDPGVPRLFGRLPRLPFGITAVPADQAPSQPAAYYLPGSVELGRPGMFYANTYDLPTRPAWNMESICLHEAVPGHHFQLTLAQETEGLPRFRQQSLACTAYVEGWGLYCESLGPELGLYADPYQRFGALDAEMMRACRLVLDTGLHALGWSRDQAIDFFAAHSVSPRHEIVVEVDRYIVWPGQALAYKVGELHLQRLRRERAAAAGDAFDLRAFHDDVLRHGALPLDLLDQVMGA
ncbi:MAG: DUF885 family protein [Acidimicrobiia bacterium]